MNGTVFRILLCLTASQAFVIDTASTIYRRRKHLYFAKRLQSENLPNIATSAEDVVDPSSSKSPASLSADDETLVRLDEKFQYDGRLPSERNVDSSPLDGYRCGYVSIIGAPNMGKSTLLNAIIEEELCITTPRPQTTRHAILGLVSNNNTQVCLVDTPGVIETPAYKLQEGMMEAVTGALSQADVLLVVTDVFSTPIPNDDIFEKVQRYAKNVPVIVAINKIDLAAKINIASYANENKLSATREQAVAVWRNLLPSALAIVPICASDGVNDPGVIALRSILLGGNNIPEKIRNLGRPVSGMFPTNVTTITDDYARTTLLPLSPPLYDNDFLTDRTERFVASEIIRSALFDSLQKEIPYCCEVRVTNFKDNSPTIIYIYADILVERTTQKRIIIGTGGEQIKTIGILARQKLEEFLQTKVFLEMKVKVDKDWRKNEGKLKEYGYI